MVEASPFQFREVVNERTVSDLALAIARVDSYFDARAFVSTCCPHVTKGHGLWQRSYLIADALVRFLDRPYDKIVPVLLKSLGPELPQKELSGYEPFFYMPHCALVMKYGSQDYDTSWRFMLEITKRFTSEWPIREFLIRSPKRVMENLMELTTSDNLHLRRFASEACRPRLPLGKQLKSFQNDPTPVLRLLHQLRDDNSIYVRRSVANNLNDIAKDNPNLVTDTLASWSRQAPKERRWVIKHALRGLLKNGHPKALEIQGFKPGIKVEGSQVNLTSLQVSWAGNLQFTHEFKALEKGKVMVDYLIYFTKLNTPKSGKLNCKTFKGIQREVQKGEWIKWSKKHSLQPRSTRKMYPGSHAIEVQINGVVVQRVEFELLQPTGLGG